ncbi:hypothetical protein TNCV_3618581 [Trichonephila clavipes]|nr:hypothetical protein TNCV_3618581 [Trichonephila clavipes]
MDNVCCGYYGDLNSLFVVQSKQLVIFQTSVCLSRRRLPPVRITSLELLLSPRQLFRSAFRRISEASGISENHSEPSLDCTVAGQSVPIQKI